jgi:hypothetical protein
MPARYGVFLTPAKSSYPPQLLSRKQLAPIAPPTAIHNHLVFNDFPAHRSRCGPTESLVSPLVSISCGLSSAQQGEYTHPAHSVPALGSHPLYLLASFQELASRSERLFSCFLFDCQLSASSFLLFRGQRITIHAASLPHCIFTSLLYYFILSPRWSHAP